MGVATDGEYSQQLNLAADNHIYFHNTVTSDRNRLCVLEITNGVFGKMVHDQNNMLLTFLNQRFPLMEVSVQYPVSKTRDGVRAYASQSDQFSVYQSNSHSGNFYEMIQNNNGSSDRFNVWDTPAHPSHYMGSSLLIT